MIIGNRDFDTKNHTYVMGILNITPDSFYDGGECKNTDAALFKAEEMIKAGADIIDVGGESTRPGATEVSCEEELKRVIPVISKLKSEFNIPVSIDTYKAKTAKEAIMAGADLINDIWGLKKDPDMKRVIFEADLPCCLMHNRLENTPLDLDELFSEMSLIADTAITAGIKEEKIILDPGIGFGKENKDSLKILANMKELRLLGFPWLLGCSRKSVIGDVLKLDKKERLEGTLALTALAAEAGASFVRVHDVKENVRIIKMVEALKNV